MSKNPKATIRTRPADRSARYEPMAALFGCLFCAACGSEAPDDASIGSVGAPILNGDAVTSNVGLNAASIIVDRGMRPNRGNRGANGSGIALNDRWVLTAAHVVVDDVVGATGAIPVLPFSRVKVTLDNNGQNPIPARSVIIHPGFRIAEYDPDAPSSNGVDAALIELSSPLTSVTSRRDFWNGSASELRTLLSPLFGCYGYGPNTVNGPHGTRRTFNFAQIPGNPFADSIFTNTVTNTVYALKGPNPSPNGQQHALPGDSGGPCLLLPAGGTVSSIIVGGGTVGTTFLPAENFRNVFDSIVGGPALPIPLPPSGGGVPNQISIIPDVIGGLNDLIIDIGSTGERFEVPIPLSVPPLPGLPSLPGLPGAISDYAGGLIGSNGSTAAVPIVGGALFLVDQIRLLNVPPFITFVPPLGPLSTVTDYRDVSVGLLDGSDAREDLVAVRESGTRHAFLGSASGLGPARVINPLRGPDFDADGFEDVAISAPNADSTVGSLHVVFGNPAKGAKSLSGVSGRYGLLSSEVAWGNFDGVGGDEIVTSAPMTTVSGHVRSGDVFIVRWDGSQFRESQRVNPSARERNQQWGSALAVGDFDGDGRDDLAVGSGIRENAEYYLERTLPKVVSIHTGQASGGVSATPKELREDAYPLVSPSASFRGRPAFGFSLAAGDFNCDGVDDLAIGAPGATTQANPSVRGAVVVVYGLKNQGLDPEAFEVISEAGFADGKLTGAFGKALAAGNFDGDVNNAHGCIDLAITSNTGWETGVGTRGRVSIVAGGPAGLNPAKRQFFGPGEGPIPDSPEIRGRFGETMTVTSANSDGYDDLVVAGVGLGGGGLVFLSGSRTGLSASEKIWRQGADGIPDTAEQFPDFTVPYIGIGAGDFFGRGLGGTSNGLLVVGAPDEGFDASNPAGWYKGTGAASFLELTRGANVVVSTARQYGKASAMFGSRDATASNFGAAITAPRPALRFIEAGSGFDLDGFAQSDFSEAPGGDSLGDAGDPLAPWTSPQTTTRSRSDTFTVGAASLELVGSGYMSLTSRAFGTAILSPIGDALAVDILVPQSASWGAVQMFVTVPAAGIQNSYLGQRELAGVAAEQWTTLRFPVSSEVRRAFLGDYPNARITIVVNTPATGVLLDGLRFVDNLQPRTVFHRQGSEGLDVVTNSLFSFDNEGDWSSPQVPVFTDGAVVSEGGASLAVAANGWTEISSRTFSTSEMGSVSSVLSVDLFVPPQPNPDFVGALQLYLSCPSAGVHNQFVGQRDLLHTFHDEFNAIQFPLANHVVTTLSGGFDDCSIKFALNVSGSGLWRLDKLGFVQP